jgi:SSS family solute:Na+ symporter
VNGLDYSVLLITLISIAVYAVWATRDRRTLSGYLRGDGKASWITIGLSVMATQASAITFMSTPGQGFASGLGFVQNYFGLPLALVVVAFVFLPLFRKLNVYTAYEFLGKRFDPKTRLLGAGLFLLQRGLSAGITIYAPAIVLSAVFGWRLDLTILASGIVAIVYTALGGTDAVNLTQKYQMGVIFAGMAAAFVIVLVKLSHYASMAEVFSVASHIGKMQAVDFSLDVHKRYTFWSGLLGGFFLSLSYFGTDQSQVQRYLGGGSLKGSRLGLMFNAVAKIPMQYMILLLGVLVFVFYQFAPAPIVFNHASWDAALAAEAPGGPLAAAKSSYEEARRTESQALQAWQQMRGGARPPGAPATPEMIETLANVAAQAQDRVAAARTRAITALRQVNPQAVSEDSDYVFIRFIVEQLPHGLIGLLVSVFFAAALSSKAAELNALGSTTTVDLYRHWGKRNLTDKHLVRASKLFTILWGVVALGFALSVRLAENLIQAVNILGSLFYGVMLGLFLVAFFLKWVRGTAVFWAGVISQLLVFILFWSLDISYLWYNLIGCVVCVGLAALLQPIFRTTR